MKRFARKTAYTLALRLAACMPPAEKRHFKQVIVKLDRLGDAVLALGSIRRLIHETREGETLLIVSSIALPLMESEFPQVAKWVLPAFCQNFHPDFLSFLAQYSAGLRAIHTERVIFLRHQRSDYLHAISHLIHAQECIATDWLPQWENVCLDWRAGRCVAYPESSDSCLELEAHRRVIQQALGYPVALSDILPGLEGPVRGEGSGQEGLLVCPQAGDTLREYPSDLLAQAVSLFLRTRPMKVTLCLPHDADPSPWMHAFERIGLSQVKVFLTGTVTELCQLIGTAALVLAPDSAPAHLATALDKKGVFWVGGGHPEMFAPWRRSSRQHWLRKSLECYGCRWLCPYGEAHCITGIAPKVMASAMEEVWARE